jgi:hypothetical protein
VHAKHAVFAGALDLTVHHFVIITDDGGLAWQQAAQYASQQLQIELPVYFIKKDHAAYDQWKQTTDIQEGEAILVRPDGFIAWRQAACSNARTVLMNALKNILSLA